MSQDPILSIPSLVPTDSDKKYLYDRVKARLNLGHEAQMHLLNQVASMVIRDKLVPPSLLKFSEGTGANEGKLVLQYGYEPDVVTIHKHALGQLAAKVNIPMTYVHHLEQTGWRLDLLAHNLTTSFKHTDFSDRSKSPPRFLHRLVGNELRGFLSRRFNRHLASMPMLQAFVDATASVGAFPMEATTTAVKLALKCYLPYIFEPIPGQPVCLGVEWSNSDFGAGRMKVAITLWMPIVGSFTVLDHTLSKVHIGSVIEEADIELSDETARKEVDAQASGIRDAVRMQLGYESIDKILKAIEVAHADAIPWHRLRGNLSRYLGKKEIDWLHSMLDAEIIDLPPVPRVNGEIHATKWWASSALSFLANKTEDADRRLELQQAAGTFIEVT